MATPTMESIKKKMQAMKQEKENASDLADQAEEKTKLAQQKLLKVAISHLYMQLYIYITGMIRI